MSEKQKLIDGLCLQRAVQILFYDTSSDDNDEDEDQIMAFETNISLTLANRRACHLHVPKSEEWVKKVLFNFDDGRMRQMLRTTTEEFKHILELIRDDPVFTNQNYVPQLPIDLQLKIALFRLGGNGDSSSIRKTATIFGVGDGETVIKVTERVIHAVINLKSRFLFWPPTDERKRLVTANMHELPGCVAYLDGSEIKLAEAPAKNHELFFSRKKQYAVKIQVVCDYKLRIRQATIGHQGSVHDAKIFSQSSLGIAPEKFLSNNEFIAADSAYPLSQNIITPFRRNSNELSREIREKFNENFSKYRVRVENCIGKLKETFGSLKEIRFRLHNKQNHTAACEWILACCILHNILIEFSCAENDEHELDELEYPQEMRAVPDRRTALAYYIMNHF